MNRSGQYERTSRARAAVLVDPYPHRQGPSWSSTNVDQSTDATRVDSSDHGVVRRPATRYARAYDTSASDPFDIRGEYADSRLSGSAGWRTRVACCLGDTLTHCWASDIAQVACSNAAPYGALDVDDVLLLRPAAPSTGFEPQPRRPRQGADVPAAQIAATMCSLNAPADPDVLMDTLLPALAEMTQPALATPSSRNRARTRSQRSLSAPANTWSWIQRVVDDNWPAPIELDLALKAPPVQLRLAPTARSRLR